MTFRADLHCHTYFSDGTDAPEAVIDKALEIGLSGLSITDHDTIAAYPEAVKIAEKKGLLLLPGIEFSAADQVHILGYAYSLKSEALRHLCAQHQRRRLERNRAILERLRGLGIVIDEVELGEGHTVGRPHIANILIARKIVGSIQEAFEKYLGEGKRAYAPGDQISVEETLHTIHAAGGLAILAHPHLLKRSSQIRHLLKLPFDGLEGYYARFPTDQEEKWLKIASERDWIVTGGSDYHGKNKPNPLGSSWVGKETFERLYGHYLAQNS